MGSDVRDGGSQIRGGEQRSRAQGSPKIIPACIWVNYCRYSL